MSPGRANGSRLLTGNGTGWKRSPSLKRELRVRIRTRTAARDRERENDRLRIRTIAGMKVAWESV